MDDVSLSSEKSPGFLRCSANHRHTPPPPVSSKKQLFCKAHVSSFFILPGPLSKKSGYQKQLEQNRASFVFHLSGFTWFPGFAPSPP